MKTLPAIAALGAAAAIPAATSAEVASPGAASAAAAHACHRTHSLTTPRKLRATVDGHKVVVGKLSVYDEGDRLCAETTSGGTRWERTEEYMEVRLSTTDRERTDAGQRRGFAVVRLPDAHHCFVAMAIIRLASGAQAGAVASCRH